MQTLLYVNPLKQGKLKDYKAFIAEYSGLRKKEYLDLLKRHGLKTVKVYFHKLQGQECIIVEHDAEDDAKERLSSFSTSQNPFDRWFWGKLVELHDLEENTEAEMLFMA